MRRQDDVAIYQTTNKSTDGQHIQVGETIDAMSASSHGVILQMGSLSGGNLSPTPKLQCLLGKGAPYQAQRAFQTSCISSFTPSNALRDSKRASLRGFTESRGLAMDITSILIVQVGAVKVFSH